jgi:TRAP-type C4-dicarboxylate transport system permease small subunit
MATSLSLVRFLVKILLHAVYGIVLEQHMTLKVMMMLLKKLYQKIFASHFGHLAIIFLGQQVIYST